MAAGRYRKVKRICAAAHAARTVVGSVPEPLTNTAVASAAEPMTRTATVTKPAPKNRAEADSQSSPALLMIDRNPVNWMSSASVATPVRNASAIRRPLLVLIQAAKFLASPKLGGLPAIRKSAI